MVPDVAQALAKLGQRDLWIGDGDFVFVSSTGAYIDYSAMVKAYKRALKRAGLRQVKFHGLRHSFGTIAVQAFPLSDVQAWMGHADIQTTMRYVHYVPKQDAAQRLGRLVSAENLAPKLAPSAALSTSPEGVEDA